MKVKVFQTLNEFDEFDFEVVSIKEILSGLKLHKGKAYTDRLLEEKFKYILIPKNENEQPIALIPEVVFSDIAPYKELLIIPNIEGEIQAAAIIPLLYGAAATAATITTTQLILAYAVTAIVNIAISMALNMVMSLLSPTKEFSSDPAVAQRNNSNLFNGAPLIREQGGSVPLAYGEGFAGGVLISSSLTTVES